MIKFADKETFIKDWNASALESRFLSINSAKKALSKTSTMLLHVSEAYGEPVSLLLIRTYIILLQTYIGVKDEARMEERSIKELAKLILEDYSQLNIAELDLVFKNIKKGIYGQIYGRIDPVFIQTSFRKYFDGERVNAMSSMITEEEYLSYEFNEENYAWAKARLAKEFNKEELEDHLTQYKNFMCVQCQIENDSCDKGCKKFAEALVNRETVNTYLIATWLLCWDK